MNGQIDHFANARDIAAVHDRIDRERQAEPYCFGRQRKLALERAAIAGNVIRRYGLGVLDRDLEMVEACLPEVLHGARGDTDARSDQIGVEAGLARRGRNLHQIAACARRAAGEVHLHHAELRDLVEHPHPRSGVELILPPLERERIGAIGTAKRTTVCQLGKQADRCGELAHISHELNS